MRWPWWRRWPLVLVLPLAVACGGEEGSRDGSVDGGIDAAGPPDAAASTGAPCEMPPMSGEVLTLAGCQRAGATDGPRGAARFANPVNVLAGAGGAVLVADFDNHRIRVVAADGATRTLVERADFQRPFGLARIGDVLFVSTDDNDRGEHSTASGTVWRVDANTGAATVVARDLGRPRSLLALPDGRLAMADYKHHTVSLLDPATARVAPLAGALDQPGYVDGRGAAARFNGAYGLARLPDGRLAVADLGNHRLRAVTLDGEVSTLAGTGQRGAADGPAAAASFAFPQGLAADAAGRLYVSDTGGFTVRRLADGKVSTVAGSGVGGWADGPLRQAQFWGLEGIALSPDGRTLWVADGSRGEEAPYHRVRRVALP